MPEISAMQAAQQAAQTPEGQFLGVKFATIIAGFIGGVVSLSYVKSLTKPQATIAVMTGAVTANYLTPAALYYLHIPHTLENPTAFVIGLTAMNLIPGLLKLSAIFKKNPERFVSLRQGQGEGDK